jgi:hypothetical protein
MNPFQNTINELLQDPDVSVWYSRIQYEMKREQELQTLLEKQDIPLSEPELPFNLQALPWEKRIPKPKRKGDVPIPYYFCPKQEKTNINYTAIIQVLVEQGAPAKVGGYTFWFMKGGIAYRPSKKEEV